MGSESYSSGRQTVSLSFAEFAFGKKEVATSTENPNPKRMVVYSTGWPWDASAKPTWDFPGQLSEGLNATCYSITTRSERDDPQGMVLQAAATRQFLMKHGLDKDTELIIVGHSAGVRKGAYLAKDLQDHDTPAAVLASVSPMGLNSRSIVGLLKDFVRDVFITGKKERQIAGVKAGDKNPVVDKVSEQEVQSGFRDSLKKKWQVGGVRGIWSQIKALVKEDPIYSQIKVPIIDIAPDRDMVSNRRSYISEAGAKSNVSVLTSQQQLELSGRLWDAKMDRIRKRDN